MNKSRYIAAAIALLAIASCQKDPWAEIADGDWNHERSIIDIKFKGQAGTPVITNTGAETGTVDLQLATAYVEDLSRVEVEYITLSYKATGSVESGGTIDFTDPSPEIVVSSPNGDVRTYKLNMTEFTETLTGKYRISVSKIFGGTGPMYGGGAVVDPAVKSWCWNPDGFGPSAEYDDYLDITLDEITDDGNTVGTCMHYGGVDGKHWNCIFEASMNKEGKDQIDLHNFYRQIPIGKSTWRRSYSDNTITFTDSTGRETVATLMESGTYEIYNQDGYTHSITIDDSAFRFALSGKDDWTNIYSDYDKFVKRPWAYFVLVSPVEEIPQESQTIGTEGDLSQPEPEPEPVFELGGTYSLTRFTVFGGCDSPAFVNPADKSWMWNSSVYKEKDNKLVLEVAEVAADGKMSGTADYQAGADGLYWDCVMLADKNKWGTGALDLSSSYGLLPKGQSRFVYDPAAGTLAFTSGIITVTVRFLLPGTYKFGENEKELVVSDVALDFDLGYTGMPEGYNQSWLWTDFDRFAVGQRNYVMLFAKDASAE